MKIRKATLSDLDIILTIYADAREYMKANGNKTQWAGGHPAESLLRTDIAEGTLYVCTEDLKNPSSKEQSEPRFFEEILGVFFFRMGEDPTYAQIYEGQWLNDAAYGVIHRIAVSKNAHGKGVAAFCFRYCFSLCPNLKIDTHRRNLPMQRALEKNGFRACGIIYLENGDERLAYQKSAK